MRSHDKNERRGKEKKNKENEIIRRVLAPRSFRSAIFFFFLRPFLVLCLEFSSRFRSIVGKQICLSADAEVKLLAALLRAATPRYRAAHYFSSG